MRATALAMLAGVLFALGLVLAGMTDPHNVIGFLDVGGDWRPNLALVMVGAIAVHFVAHRVIVRRRSPLLRDVFHLPTARELDRGLLLGAALFGVGWGLAGVCPGPALVVAGSGGSAVVFLVALVLGMLLHDRTTLGPRLRGRVVAR